MIIWVILFLIIVIVSFILALRSMRDYHDIPVNQQTNYSLYLIKNEVGLTEDFLEQINKIIDKKRLIISLERLYKGTKKALVIYGPVTILKQFSKELDLMELEDYSLKNEQGDLSHNLCWEVSAKHFQKINASILGLREVSENLREMEEIWWQLVLQPQCERNGIQPIFKAFIRVVVICADEQKGKDIKLNLEKQIKESGLLSLPQAYSSSQILQFYQKRSLPQKFFTKEDGHFIITSDKVEYLLN